MRRVLISGLLGLLACSVACTNKKVNNPLANVGSKQPDKVLFDRSMDAMKHNRFDVARMTLQTLINTYPDSEFIARAKLKDGVSLEQARAQMDVIGQRIAAAHPESNKGWGVLVDPLAEQLIQHGYATYPVLGAALDPSFNGTGVRIARITPGGGAEKAGLQVGDIVVSVDGKPVTAPEELIVAIRSKHPGDTLEIGYQRGAGSATSTATVTLGESRG